MSLFGQNPSHVEISTEQLVEISTEQLVSDTQNCHLMSLKVEPK